MRFTSSTILSLSTLFLTASAQFIMPLENPEIEAALNELLVAIPECSYECLYEASNLASVFRKGSPCSGNSDSIPDYIFNSGIKCACEQIDFDGVAQKWQDCVKAEDNCALDAAALGGANKALGELVELCENQPANTNVTIPDVLEPGKNQTSNNGTDNDGPKQNDDDSGSATLTASLALMGLGLSAVMALGF